LKKKIEQKSSNNLQQKEPYCQVEQRSQKEGQKNTGSNAAGKTTLGGKAPLFGG